MRDRIIGAARLRALDDRVSARDRAVLHSLDEHRFLLTSQIQRLHFDGHRSASAGIRACVRALDRLCSLGLIGRLERQVGGHNGGSRGFVWALEDAGRRLVRGSDDAPPRRRKFEPTTVFLEHTLDVADLRVQVEEAARAGAVELLSVQTEPTCWREYVGVHGEPAILKPDLALVTAIGDYEDHWFIEIDRGTESIPTVLAKCEQYEAYRRTGREQASAGVFPLIVWSVLDERRRTRIEAEVGRTRGLASAHYRVVLAEDALSLITGDSPPPAATTHVDGSFATSLTVPSGAYLTERRTTP